MAAHPITNATIVTGTTNAMVTMAYSPKRFAERAPVETPKNALFAVLPAHSFTLFSSTFVEETIQCDLKY